MKIGAFVLCFIVLFVTSSCSAKNRDQFNEPKSIIQKVNWPDSSMIDKSTASLLTKEDENNIFASNVPVLFLKPTQSIPESIFIVGPYSYAASFKLNNETYFSIIGTKIAYQGNESMRPNFNCIVRGINGIVGENIGIWSVTWSEYGASYAIDIECSNQNNPHCSKDYIVQLANNLVYLGGSGK